VPLRDVGSYEKTDLFSYHCDKVRYLRVSSMDPSMVLGFFVKSPQEFHQFCSSVQELTGGPHPLFTIAQSPEDFNVANTDLLTDEE
ncbi:Cysteine protease atg4c, partial [Kappamyces sp. JEL0680]